MLFRGEWVGGGLGKHTTSGFVIGVWVVLYLPCIRGGCIDG